MKKYFSMNNIEIGTKMEVLKTGEVDTLYKIFHYPTLFQVKNDKDKFNVYKTHELKILQQQ